ncbi:BCCT family transporter [Proteiniclasticum sp. BAD-10]|uniref:BCCT family transporter n=1 Tax=Proteiniclasticum sediminis TaxID=2804028 RepID=A0A941CS41_9CLOT|nr:BCCT family transporter [Proteiniclasticum sediminis]MBR0576351.1 BCCT family transporter [Proteiniclasticum sediminis]
MKKIKPIVFFPPVILLLVAVIVSFLDKEAFSNVVNGTNSWILVNFGWLFSLSGIIFLIVIIGLYFSPFGKVKIGGSKAKPLLGRFEWFSITLTTGIAIGLLFWATAEPMYHLLAPPASLNIEPSSPEAAVFSLSSLMLHWTFTPYAIYTVPAVIFAFAYYNMKKPYSLGSTMDPILGKKSYGKIGQGIDAICLYALVGGMAASLGTGVLTVSGGLTYLFGIESNPTLWLIVDIVIVVAFVLSAITGLMNGVKNLSKINTWLFIGLAIFVFAVGPTVYILNLGVESFADYITNFMQKSLFTGIIQGDSWPQGWTMFYWANWLAWAPITGLFLGRISYGYKVKDMIMTNFILPSLFGLLWMSIYGGGAIYSQLNGVPIAEAVTSQGPEAAVYLFFSQYPLAKIIIPIFIFAAFLSYVTGADAMTSSMGGMSTTGISPDSPEPSIGMKVFWGALLCIVSWVMLAFAGIDGIKMLSNLGGFPALFLELAMAYSIVKVAKNPMKYDTFKEDYTADGVPIESHQNLGQVVPLDNLDQSEEVEAI